MFVRTPEDIAARGGDRIVADGRARVLRYAVRSDDIGFSFSDVRVAAGVAMELWYKHHWEANYVVSGDAEVKDLTSGHTWLLTPGSLYCVGPTDRHELRAITDGRWIAVFNPALEGTETHGADGAYPPTGPVPDGPGAMFVKSVKGLRAAGAELTVADGSARTVRMLTRADGLGFTVSDVNLAAGATATLWYKNHREANFILSGRGEVADLGTGETWALHEGVMYVVGPDDRHTLRADTDLHLLSIFCPALEGDEMHDPDGALPPSGPLLPN